ncbi:unnamed protein product, partial [Protopolystoma xenopodis]
MLPPTRGQAADQSGPVRSCPAAFQKPSGLLVPMPGRLSRSLKLRLACRGMDVQRRSFETLRSEAKKTASASEGVDACGGADDVSQEGLSMRCRGRQEAATCKKGAPLSSSSSSASSSSSSSSSCSSPSSSASSSSASSASLSASYLSFRSTFAYLPSLPVFSPNRPFGLAVSNARPVGMAVGKTRSFIGFCNHLPVGRPPFSAS